MMKMLMLMWMMSMKMMAKITLLIIVSKFKSTLLKIINNVLAKQQAINNQITITHLWMNYSVF